MRRKYRSRRFFLLLICIGFFYLCFRIVFNTDLFVVEEIILEGNINITANELKYYMLDEENHMLKMSTYDLNKRLLANPRVKSGVVKKIYPNQLQITIEERIPVMVVQYRELFYLCDEEGVLIRVDGNKKIYDNLYNTYFYLLENVNVKRFAPNYELVIEEHHIFDDAVNLVYYLDLYEMQDSRMIIENEQLVLYLDQLKVVFSNGGDMVEKINKFYNLYLHLLEEGSLAGEAIIYKNGESSFEPIKEN